MASKPEPKALADKVALYDRLLATQGLERKGAAMPYTSVNGNMFSQLNPSGTLALRLPEGAREAFLQAHGARLHEAYGIVQKEYVAVPDALLADTGRLGPHFAESLAYANSLKPKPTTKPKKT
ncbi:MAG: hypothetical protein JSR45_17100 [Proteobacteria bacterium]|nr:hypothetical protein [Pseudomonadota bacterium]